jgi:hypothetical protein
MKPPITLASVLACGLLLFVAHFTAADDRMPLPDAAALAEAEGLLQEVFGKEIATATTAAARLALGRQLLDEADKAADDPAGGYVLVRKVCELGVEAGDAGLVGRAVDLMVGRYRLDAAELRRDYLAKAAAAADGVAASRAFGQACAELMEQAATDDRFDAATDYGRAAYAAAQRGRDSKLAERLRVRGPEIVALAGEYQRFIAAQETLSATPDDAEANLVAGRYLAAVKGDWNAGLPMLAKAADPVWRTPAQFDVASPADPPACLAVADAWWDLGNSLAEPYRGNLLDRAGHWYRLAMPGLPAADRGRVVQRLAALKGFARGGSSEVAAPPSREAGPASETAAAADDIPIGQWIDLLPRVVSKRHAVSGEWRLGGGGLDVLPAAEPARLTLPVAPGGNYDLEIEFTRTGTFGTVGAVLTVGDRQCLAALNFAGGPSGLDTIDGRRADNNASSFAGALNNDRKYTLELSVRIDGSEAAVTARLDDRPLFFYRGPVASLALERQWRVHDARALGLAAQSPVRFHRVRLKVASGQPKPLK